MKQKVIDVKRKKRREVAVKTPMRMFTEQAYEKRFKMTPQEAGLTVRPRPNPDRPGETVMTCLARTLPKGEWQVEDTYIDAVEETADLADNLSTFRGGQLGSVWRAEETALSAVRDGAETTDIVLHMLTGSSGSSSPPAAAPADVAGNVPAAVVDDDDDEEDADAEEDDLNQGYQRRTSLFVASAAPKASAAKASTPVKGNKVTKTAPVVVALPAAKPAPPPVRSADIPVVPISGSSTQSTAPSRRIVGKTKDTSLPAPADSVGDSQDLDGEIMPALSGRVAKRLAESMTAEKDSLIAFYEENVLENKQFSYLLATTGEQTAVTEAVTSLQKLLTVRSAEALKQVAKVTRRKCQETDPLTRQAVELKELIVSLQRTIQGMGSGKADAEAFQKATDQLEKTGLTLPVAARAKRATSVIPNAVRFERYDELSTELAAVNSPAGLILCGAPSCRVFNKHLVKRS